jgi:hypothetical protein
MEPRSSLFFDAKVLDIGPDARGDDDRVCDHVFCRAAAFNGPNKPSAARFVFATLALVRIAIPCLSNCAGDFRNFIILRRQDLRQRFNHDNFRSERVAPAPTTSMPSGVRFGIIASK